MDWNFVCQEFVRLCVKAGVTPITTETMAVNAIPGVVYLTKEPLSNAAAGSSHAADYGPRVGYAPVGSHVVSFPKDDLWAYTPNAISFALAHEIAHVLHNDALPENIAIYGTPDGYAEVEKLADSKALELTGFDDMVIAEMQGCAHYARGVHRLSERLVLGGERRPRPLVSAIMTMVDDPVAKIRYGANIWLVAETLAAVTMKVFDWYESQLD